MTSEFLTLVVNPGSSSRKYALYADGLKRANIHFEFENENVIGKIEYNGEKHTKTYGDSDLSEVSRYVLPLLRDYGVIADNETLSVIGIRVVAPSKRFAQDVLVTNESEADLEFVQQRAPLHVKTALAEIKQLKNFFPGTSIVIVSDSAFHSTKPEWAWHYGIDTEIAEKFDIKRYGFHGVSVGSVVRNLSETGLLKPKTIICHLGSGSSVTAVENGKSIETTMGYTPLEGLMMASRCGNIDPSAVVAVKRELHLSDDDLEEYLNKQCGLLGVSGSSNDVRQLLASEEQGDARAKLALKMLVYRIQQAIGQMAASMSGVDQLVFTATIGERSAPIRERVLENLSFLGFDFDKALNDSTFEPKEATNIAIASSKPVLVISTDESSEIARRAEQYIKTN